MYCKWCNEGNEPVVLDIDGVLSSVSGTPGCWGHNYEDTWWPCERKAAEEHAIVAKLPVTKDGVPVVPRMRVWLDAETVWYRLQPKGEITEVCVSWVGTEQMPMMVELPTGVGWHILPCRVYSTRQAAEAAEQKASTA